MTRLIGTILRLTPRCCSSSRVSVNRMGRSLSLHSCLMSCVCSMNMSITWQGQQTLILSQEESRYLLSLPQLRHM